MNELEQMPGLKKKNKWKKTLTGQPMKISNLKEFKSAIFSSELFFHA